MKVTVKWRKFRIMTRKFQIGAQLLATFAQTMMGPMERYFGWNASLSELLHASISFGQLALGVIGSGYNPDGTPAPPSNKPPQGGE